MMLLLSTRWGWWLVKAGNFTMIPNLSTPTQPPPSKGGGEKYRTYHPPLPTSPF